MDGDELWTRCGNASAKTYMKTSASGLGGEWVERMMRSCRASAAVAVTNQLHPGLSDRIGVSNGEVSWMALARVICNVVPLAEYGCTKFTSPGFFSPVICD